MELALGGNAVLGPAEASPWATLLRGVPGNRLLSGMSSEASAGSCELVGTADTWERLACLAAGPGK